MTWAKHELPRTKRMHSRVISTNQITEKGLPGTCHGCLGGDVQSTSGTRDKWGPVKKKKKRKKKNKKKEKKKKKKKKKKTKKKKKKNKNK